MDVLKQLLGRLHPLFVHLPIGFIILGLLIKWYDRKKNAHTDLLPLIFLWAGYSAVLACITGYAQYIGEGYAFETVKIHLWVGIATAVFSFIMYAKLKELKAVAFLSKVSITVLSVVSFILISFTGHEGGTITHGEDYLIEPLPNSVKSALGFETYEEKDIVLTDENWQEAQLYEDVIKPILNNKCISCHNPKKSKGGLLLHSEEAILKGGENGPVITANKASESELFTRMKLPKEDDNHMPPEGKSQPSKEEITLIGAWIDAGHPFDKSIGELNLKKNLFLPFIPKKAANNYPDIEITAASADSIKAIEKTGVHVDLISKSSNFLTVSCINKPAFTNADFDALLPIKSQIAVLDLGGTKITDAIVEKLPMLTNLTVLKLDNTQITGENIEKLDGLAHLKSLNVTYTNFAKEHLTKLANFKKLEKVYVYNTPINATDSTFLKGSDIHIDYGNYQLPQIAADTIVY